MRKPVMLMAGQFGSRHFGTHPFLAEAFELAACDAPLALYVGAASGDDRSFAAALAGVLEAAGARRVLWPKLAGPRRERRAARSALAEADLVFVGGGDVEAGMQVLRDADLIDAFCVAANRGAVFAGLSAGAIMLGERWIRWAHAGAGDDGAETFECLNVAPGSFDVHGEADDWREARSFAAVRARETGKRARAHAIPSGGALVIRHDGTTEARGGPVTVFAALPNQAARIEGILEAVN